jgi:NAD(P)-dependent dehydrogenase (short-subunit alcohol dehydrogenase family)
MSKRAQSDERIRAFMRTRQPLDWGRMVGPEDLDAAVARLLSDAGRFVMGQTLEIDGGGFASEAQTQAERVS